MSNFQGKNEDMSMEDILNSIRKYVSEEDESKKKAESKHPKEQIMATQESVIKLEHSHMASQHSQDDGESEFNSQDNSEYEEKSSLAENVHSVNKGTKITSPFGKLSDTMKSYGRKETEKKENAASQLTIDRFLSDIASNVIQKWVDENLRTIVDEAVAKEIEKIKAED